MSEDGPEDRNAMSFRELVNWAWSETAPVHRNRTNLLIHIFAVPMFVIGNVLLLVAVFQNLWLALAGVLAIAASLTFQKIGHAREQIEVIPFSGPYDFLRRVYAEQFCNFWRFLFSGNWRAAFKASAS